MRIVARLNAHVIARGVVIRLIKVRARGPGRFVLGPDILIIFSKSISMACSRSRSASSSAVMHVRQAPTSCSDFYAGVRSAAADPSPLTILVHRLHQILTTACAAERARACSP